MSINTQVLVGLMRDLPGLLSHCADDGARSGDGFGFPLSQEVSQLIGTPHVIVKIASSLLLASPRIRSCATPPDDRLPRQNQTEEPSKYSRTLWIG